MKLFIDNMNEKFAKEILHWKYEKPYDFYNSALTEEDMEERLNGSYYTIVDDNQDLFGFFCTGQSAQIPIGNQFGVYNDDFIDIGLGMNPQHTGKGKGFEFCSFILHYITENDKRTPIRLSVAMFNQRAIRLYEKLGFVKENEFRTDVADFITMVKES